MRPAETEEACDAAGSKANANRATLVNRLPGYSNLA
jgi:hypothetical protein